jgi:hypothetical protein
MKILLATLAGFGAAKTKTECEACKELQKGIENNLEKTRNQNFGGGNSNWEESRLGKILFGVGSDQWLGSEAIQAFCLFSVV